MLAEKQAEKGLNPYSTGTPNLTSQKVIRLLRS